MAIPAMTNNSPSTGQIAWGAFSIQYNGVSYSISAGSTGQRWVWWRYNAGSPVIEAGPEIGQPFGGSLTPLTDDDLLLFGNKNGISMRIQSTQVLDGELLVDGSIFSDAIATNQVNSNHIVTAGLDAGVIKFGTMSGDRIATNTLLVSQLVVTDLENCLDNPVAQLGAVNAGAPGWAGSSTAFFFCVTPTTISTTLPDGTTGRVLQMNGTGTQQVALNSRTTIVKPGDQFWLSGYFRKVSGTDTTGTLKPLAVVATKQDGTTDIVTMSITMVDDGTGTGTSVPANMQVDISTLTAGTWQSIEGVYTVPTGVIKLQFFMSVGGDISDGVYQFWGLEARRKGAGKLIVDGSINSLQVDTDELTAAIVSTGVLQSQFTITGVLDIDGADAGWSAADGLWLGSKVKFFHDSRINQVEGDLVTSSLTVKDGLSIGGNADIHGVVAMGNGVPNPTAKMSLGQTWPSFQTSLWSGTEDQSNIFHGMYDLDGSNWLVSFQFFGAGLRKISKAAGALGGYISLGSWKDKFYPVGGLCVIGGSTGNAYLLGHDQSKGDEYYLIRVNLSTGAQTASIRIGGTDPFNGKRPGLVTDGVNVGMLWCPQSTGNLMLRWYNAGLTAQQGADINLFTDIGFANIGDAYYGPGASGGTTRLWVSIFSGDSNLVRCWTPPAAGNTSAPTRYATEDFVRASNTTLIGLSYDTASQRMYHMDKFCKMYKYSNYTVGGTLNAQYTYYDDSTGTYPAGTIIGGVDKSGTASTKHETSPSPVNSFTLSARAFPVITAPPAPDELVTDATQVDKANMLGVYASVGSTPRLIAYLPVGQRTVDVAGAYAVDPLSTSGALAGSSGIPSFATAAVPAPGRLKSVAESPAGSPLIDLYGDGHGRVGPYEWDSSGKPLARWDLASTGTQSVSPSTFTIKTSWNTKDSRAPYVGISLGSPASGQITVSQAGLYLVMAGVTINGTAVERRAITAIYVNGTAVARAETSGGAANQNLTPVVSTIVYLAAGDVIDVRGWHNQAAAQPWVGNEAQNFWSGYCIAAF